MMSGLRNISYLRFGVHSALGIFLWVMVLGGFGYFCGEIMLSNIQSVGDYKFEIIGILALVGLGYWFFVKLPEDRYCYQQKIREQKM